MVLRRFMQKPQASNDLATAILYRIPGTTLVDAPRYIMLTEGQEPDGRWIDADPRGWLLSVTQSSWVEFQMKLSDNPSPELRIRPSQAAARKERTWKSRYCPLLAPKPKRYGLNFKAKKKIYCILLARRSLGA